MEKLAGKIVDWQIEREFLNQQDRSLYVYAYGLLIGQGVNLLISCLLAVMFRSYMVVFVYLVSYIPLRSYAGGHHAGSYGLCTFISTIILTAACIMAKVIPQDMIFVMGVAVMSAGTWFMVKRVPVEAEKKPLSQNEKQVYRKRCIAIWITEVVIWGISFFIGYKQISLSITLAHLTLICMLYLGFRKTK